MARKTFASLKLKTAPEIFASIIRPKIAVQITPWVRCLITKKSNVTQKSDTNLIWADLSSIPTTQ